MYKTKIDLSEKVRRNVVVILNDRLAEAIDLQSQVKQAHWNVKGPNFIALHELFDKISDAVLAAFGKSVRSAIDDTDEFGDKDTADLFTGISRQVDKYLWFLEAHLQDKA
jgi:starvation-inducible DNA-binding protein